MRVHTHAHMRMSVAYAEVGITMQETEIMFAALKKYTQRGGMWGMLDPAVAEQQGDTPVHYLTGHGKRSGAYTSLN